MAAAFRAKAGLRTTVRMQNFRALLALPVLVTGFRHQRPIMASLFRTSSNLRTLLALHRQLTFLASPHVHRCRTRGTDERANRQTYYRNSHNDLLNSEAPLLRQRFLGRYNVLVEFIRCHHTANISH